MGAIPKGNGKLGVERPRDQEDGQTEVHLDGISKHQP
jgi:hypothetical protein